MKCINILIINVCFHKIYLTTTSYQAEHASNVLWLSLYCSDLAYIQALGPLLYADPYYLPFLKVKEING